MISNCSHYTKTRSYFKSETMAFGGDFSNFESHLDSEKMIKFLSLLKEKQTEFRLNETELLAKFLADLKCLEHIPKFIATIINPEETRNHVELCCDVIKQLETTRQCPNPRQRFKQAFSNAIKSQEKIVREKIESKNIDDIRFVMAKANLVGYMFDSDLTSFKVIHKWTKSVLKSDQNPFIRLNVLMIIRERVDTLVHGDHASNVLDLYDSLLETGCYENYAIREQKNKK